MYYCSRGPTFTIVVEAPRFAHQVGRKLRGLLSRWVSLGLNDLRSPPTLSDDSHDLVLSHGQPLDYRRMPLRELRAHARRQHGPNYYEVLDTRGSLRTALVGPLEGGDSGYFQATGL